eukprot:30907-Eustigmatos_ZCMA.PRE.1
MAGCAQAEEAARRAVEEEEARKKAEEVRMSRLLEQDYIHAALNSNSVFLCEQHLMQPCIHTVTSPSGDPVERGVRGQADHRSAVRVGDRARDGAGGAAPHGQAQARA